MFILFAYDQYYPEGGADDSLGVYDTLDLAEAAFDNHPYANHRDYVMVASIVGQNLVIVSRLMRPASLTQTLPAFWERVPIATQCQPVTANTVNRTVTLS